MNAFVKKEPVLAAGPALVAGIAPEDDLPAAMPPTVSLTGPMGAAIAREHGVGDEVNVTAKLRISSVDGDNVELDVVDLTPEPTGTTLPEDESAESAIDSYLGGKGRSGSAEELA